MGLSNEERRTKMFWAIRHLNHLVHDADTTRSLGSYTDTYGLLAGNIQRLKGKIDLLWHAFLGGKSNGGFWFFGGELNNPVESGGGPWATAIEYLCDTHRKDPSVLRMSDLAEDAPFSPFDNSLSEAGLIGSSGSDGPVLRTVYEIYGNLEFLSYALRRYDDDMLAGLDTLNKILSDCMGICFDIFAHNEAFGRAYVLHRTLHWVYSGKDNTYARFNQYEPDEVAKWLLTSHMHHDLSRPMGRDSSLAEIIEWDRWRLTHKATPQNRLKLALRIAGRRFHYDHNFNQLLEAAKGMKPRPREKTLKKVFKKCKAAHKAGEAENSPTYLDDTRRNAHTVVHGFRAYRWLKDEPK